jgi:hypothetical protein
MLPPPTQFTPAPRRRPPDKLAPVTSPLTLPRAHRLEHVVCFCAAAACRRAVPHAKAHHCAAYHCDARRSPISACCAQRCRCLPRARLGPSCHPRHHIGSLYATCHMPATVWPLLQDIVATSLEQAAQRRTRFTHSWPLPPSPALLQHVCVPSAMPCLPMC